MGLSAEVLEIHGFTGIQGTRPNAAPALVVKYLSLKAVVGLKFSFFPHLCSHIWEDQNIKTSSSRDIAYKWRYWVRIKLDKRLLLFNLTLKSRRMSFMGNPEVKRNIWQDSHLFCHISICWVWVKCLRVRHFRVRNSRRHARECHSMNTCCPHLGRKSNIPCNRSHRG